MSIYSIWLDFLQLVPHEIFSDHYNRLQIANNSVGITPENSPLMPTITPPEFKEFWDTFALSVISGLESVKNHISAKYSIFRCITYEFLKYDFEHFEVILGRQYKVVDMKLAIDIKSPHQAFKSIKVEFKRLLRNYCSLRLYLILSHFMLVIFERLDGLTLTERLMVWSSIKLLISNPDVLKGYIGKVEADIARLKQAFAIPQVVKGTGSAIQTTTIAINVQLADYKEMYTMFFNAPYGDRKTTLSLQKHWKEVIGTAARLCKEVSDLIEVNLKPK